MAVTHPVLPAVRVVRSQAVLCTREGAGICAGGGSRQECVPRGPAEMPANHFLPNSPPQTRTWAEAPEALAELGGGCSVDTAATLSPGPGVQPYPLSLHIILTREFRKGASVGARERGLPAEQRRDRTDCPSDVCHGHQAAP